MLRNKLETVGLGKVGSRPIPLRSLHVVDKQRLGVSTYSEDYEPESVLYILLINNGLVWEHIQKIKYWKVSKLFRRTSSF